MNPLYTLLACLILCGCSESEPLKLRTPEERGYIPGPPAPKRTIAAILAPFNGRIYTDGEGFAWETDHGDSRGIESLPTAYAAALAAERWEKGFFTKTIKEMKDIRDKQPKFVPVDLP